MLGNQASWIFHQFKDNTTSFGFIGRWWNKDNSFFTNPCKVVSFDVIASRMELSSSSTIISSIPPSMLGFKN
jgi:hypothetical protein